ncbi:MAG: DUF3616 domain-containing protein [Lautropia sp.]|nr:DUF3616 domain-containing protein [Lautropia sp.]
MSDGLDKNPGTNPPSADLLSASPARQFPPIASDAQDAHDVSSKTKSGKSKKKKKKQKGLASSHDSTVIIRDADILGSKRGVETMFRNVFRSELDLITLAATKANIMISLNGLIVSALMISGAFIYASSPRFMVPAYIFMATAAGSIAFALLSASPERADMPGALWDWIKDVCRGRARLRDFTQRVVYQKESFVTDEANILIFKDRVKLSREEYWEKMLGMINDREQVYSKMSAQLYWLGLMADRKFKYLNVSYSIFRWGLLASVLAFIGIRMLPGTEQQPSLLGTLMNSLGAPAGIGSGTGTGNDGQPQRFKSTYEPSAVQQLDDGRLLIVEDESRRAFSLLKAGPDGQLIEDDDIDAHLLTSFKRKLNDVEALAKDDNGYIYATTSHSTNKQGERNPDREQLLRFRIMGNDAREVQSYPHLIDRLQASATLQEKIVAQGGAKADFRTTNIEGMAWDPVNKHLLLGFREPLVDGKSMIIAIGNPDAMFLDGADPEFAAVYFLDLQGGGIRGMDYDPKAKQYLITNEVRNAAGKNRSQLWTWTGDAASAPVNVPMPAFQRMKNVEAVGLVTLNGKPYYLFMSDEGDAAANITGQYLKLGYDKGLPTAP